MRPFDYYKPQSLKEVFDLRQSMPDARLIAGGTDLMIRVKKKELSPTALISLRSIPELTGVEIGKVTRIGAMTTINDIIRHPKLGEHCSVLVEAAGRMANMQIRNVATIGGNLCNCSPCADMATPLLVLDATLRFQSSDGSARTIPISDFFHGPGVSCLGTDEILTDILLPHEQKTRATFLKNGRVKMDLAIASVSVLLNMNGDTCKKARIAAGSVAPVPLRLLKVEALLENATITPELILEAQRLAATNVSPITDIRATESYRRQIVGVYVKRSIYKILGWSNQ